jgi:hypothetical protein
VQIIKNGLELKPPKIFIYGGAGQGKSTVASQARNPIFVPTEDGLNLIKCESFPVAQSLAEVETNLALLLTEKHDYKTVVIDTVDWLEKLIWAEICRESKAKDIVSAGGGYGRGYMLALAKWEQIRIALQALNTQRGMEIVFVAHMQTTIIHDPEIGDVTQYAPKIHARANALICEWCDAVLFITRRFGSIKGENEGGELGFKTRSTKSFYAKSRYNLPEFIPLNWQTLENCIQEGWAAQQEGQDNGTI